MEKSTDAVENPFLQPSFILFALILNGIQPKILFHKENEKKKKMAKECCHSRAFHLSGWKLIDLEP